MHVKRMLNERYGAHRLPDDVLGARPLARAARGHAGVHGEAAAELGAAGRRGDRGVTTYRVVQWATGNIGTRSLRGVIEHPDLELVGRVGPLRRQGRPRRRRPVRPRPGGVAATNDIDDDRRPRRRLRPLHAARAATSTRCAGCSRRAPTSSRPGASSTARRAWTPTLRERVEAACAEGGTSIHSTGSSPGFITEALPARAHVDPAPARPADHRRVRRPVAARLARPAVRRSWASAGRRPPSTSGRLDARAHQLRPVAAAARRRARRCRSTTSRRAARSRWPRRDGRDRRRHARGRHRRRPAHDRDRHARRPPAAAVPRPLVLHHRPRARRGTCAATGWRVHGRGRRPARRRAALPVPLERMADVSPGYTANRAVNAVPVVCAAPPGIRTTRRPPPDHRPTSG